MSNNHNIRVTDLDTGAVLYDGPDKREPGGIVVGPIYHKKRFFSLDDLTITDIFKFVGILWAAFMLLGRIDTRITKIEGDSKVLIAAMSKVTEFIKNSDGFHSASISTLFENGKPSNANYNFRAGRDKIRTD